MGWAPRRDWPSSGTGSTSSSSGVPGARGPDGAEIDPYAHVPSGIPLGDRKGLEAFMGFFQQQNMITVKGATYLLLTDLVEVRAGTALAVNVMTGDQVIVRTFVDDLEVCCEDLEMLMRLHNARSKRPVEWVVRLLSYEVADSVVRAIYEPDSGTVPEALALVHAADNEAGTFNLLEGLRFMWRGMIEAVCELHASQVTRDRHGAGHGGLAPAEFVLDRGVVKLGSLGRTTRRDRSAFSAPECGPPTPAGDIWSLGALLYFLVFRRPPPPAFDGRCEPPPNFPEADDLADAIGACCAAEPTARPTARKLLRHPFVGSARTLEDDLLELATTIQRYSMLWEGEFASDLGGPYVARMVQLMKCGKPIVGALDRRITGDPDYSSDGD